MKVIVSQYGARRRYLIPQILEKYDSLCRLYTDSNASSLLGKVSTTLLNLGFSGANLHKLSNRKPQIPKSKIISNEWLLIAIKI